MKWIIIIINNEFLGGALLIKTIRKLCVTATEKYYSTTYRYICPIFHKHRVVWSSFEFQQKADSVWSCKPPCTDFFNSFIVKKLEALCIETTFTGNTKRISSFSLIERFSLSSGTIVDIYSDTVWESRQWMILHLYL